MNSLSSLNIDLVPWYKIYFYLNKWIWKFLYFVIKRLYILIKKVFLLSSFLIELIKFMIIGKSRVYSLKNSSFEIISNKKLKLLGVMSQVYY